uniref:Uncharacterized protein n=1 Tax=Aliivibrio phage vB_Alvi_H905 TaxID=3234039 RepID=A0AB39C9P5_9VIRU
MKLNPPTNLREVKTRTCSNCEYCIKVKRVFQSYNGNSSVEKENGCKRNSGDDFEMPCAYEEIERFVCDGFKWKKQNNQTDK